MHSSTVDAWQNLFPKWLASLVKCLYFNFRSNFTTKAVDTGDPISFGVLSCHISKECSRVSTGSVNLNFQVLATSAPIKKAPAGQSRVVHRDKRVQETTEDIVIDVAREYGRETQEVFIDPQLHKTLWSMPIGSNCIKSLRPTRRCACWGDSPCRRPSPRFGFWFNYTPSAPFCIITARDPHTAN